MGIIYKMKILGPRIKSTLCSPDCREWVPSTLDNLLSEIEYISKINSEADALTLFRGQSNSGWPLDSTFVRNGISTLFGINLYQQLPGTIRNEVSFHRSMAALLLMKFGTIIKPSREALDKERSHGIDPWYELQKNVQQYPENYNEVPFIKGTFFLDWTYLPDIALYFATFDGVKSGRRISANNGAVWVYDASSTGKILQEEKLGKILKLMTTPDFLNGEKTFPLMFHPRRQTSQLRAVNQEPIYIAQMDFRYDLADVWASYELQGNEKVFFKIHVLESLKHDLAKYLESKGITEEHVYPH